MSNKYKLICLDLDGTFLTSKRKLNKKTLNYIKALHKKGINISISTGRPSFDAKFHADQVGKDVYYIASNGAVLGHNIKDELFYEESFTDVALSKIVDETKKYRIKPIFYTKNDIILWGPRNFLVHMIIALVAAKQLFKYMRYFLSFKKIDSYTRDKNDAVEKAVYYTRSNTLLNRIKNHLGEELFDLAITDDSCIEITPKGVNKARGVKELIDHLGITKEEVIAFGDSENDIEMLKFAGCGVAVGNACQRVKDIADQVCDTNDNDGIYKLLHEIYGDLNTN